MRFFEEPFWNLAEIIYKSYSRISLQWILNAKNGLQILKSIGPQNPENDNDKMPRNELQWSLSSWTILKIKLDRLLPK